ncbi:MAG: hypothetical protein M3R38_03800 [Actinomycetota bacterium]|nr:hypothetical protein [Actinomycetota bacterium]
MTAEEIAVHPTVILRVGDTGFDVVTAGKGEREALIVFRGPEDAQAFRDKTGKAAAAEGYELIGINPEALASLVAKLGVRLVVMPESPYTGGEEGGVDTFDAGDFVAMLAESERG